jgi:hypothetical protein
VFIDTNLIDITDFIVNSPDLVVPSVVSVCVPVVTVVTVVPSGVVVDSVVVSIMLSITHD